MAMFFSRHFLHNHTSFLYNISSNETDDQQLTSCDDLLPFADSNDTSDDYGPEADAEFTCSLYDFLIEAVLMGVLCVFGFFGNSLSTVCLWKDKSKTATPLLLISLECADTLFLVTVLLLRVFTSIETFTHRLPIVSELTPYIGKYVYPCAMLTNMGTIYLTILVTVNRYISVCKPFDASSLCSIQQSRKQVVIVWIISFLFNVPRFLEYEIVEDFDPCTNETFARSLPSWLTVNPVYQIVYANTLYFIVMFLVPLTSLVFLNTSLVIALRRTRKKRERMRAQKRSNSSSITGGCSGGGGGTGNGNNNNASNNRSEDDITLMLIVVVVVFIVSQSPALVTQILLFVLDGELTCPNTFFFYERISDLLVVANSSLNFIVLLFLQQPLPSDSDFARLPESGDVGGRTHDPARKIGRWRRRWRQGAPGSDRCLQVNGRDTGPIWPSCDRTRSKISNRQIIRRPTRRWQ